MMAIALVMLWLGRKNYIRIPPTGTPKTTFIGMNIKALRLFLNNPRAGVWAQLETEYGAEKVDSIQAVWRVAIFFLFVPISLSVYYTNGVDWLLDAQNPNMIKNFFGIQLEAGQLQTVNPDVFLLFIPLSVWLFPRLERATGIALTAKRKMLLGFIPAGIYFARVLGVAPVHLDLNRQAHVGWQVLALVILSAAEILVSITGLQYGYTHAPRSMKSTIGAIWLLTTALGNALNAWFKDLATNDPAFSMLKCNTNFYWTLSVLLVINILLFWMVMPRLKEKIYV